MLGFWAETFISFELKVGFPCFNFVELFIQITSQIIEIDCGTKIFGKTCSAINFLI